MALSINQFARSLVDDAYSFIVVCCDIILTNLNKKRDLEIVSHKY